MKTNHQRDFVAQPPTDNAEQLIRFSKSGKTPLSGKVFSATDKLLCATNIVHRVWLSRTRFHENGATKSLFDRWANGNQFRSFNSDEE